MPNKVNIKRNWSGPISGSIKTGLLDMTTTIHERSTVLVPKKDRYLVNSGKIAPITNGFKITYGNSTVPYARIHELGGMTGRGHSVSITAKHYLGNAADSVVRGNIGKYFRGQA